MNIVQIKQICKPQHKNSFKTKKNMEEKSNFIDDNSNSRQNGFKKISHCQCLYEIENKLPQTRFCLVACHDQLEILRQNNKQK